MTADPFAIHREVHVLYEGHHGWLQGWLRRRLGNAADAADLAHDAFLRLILKPVPKGFASPLEARAYLKSMAQGMCIDLWRRRQVEQAWLDTLAAQPEPCQPSPEHQAIVIETLMEIGALIGQLPAKVGHAFVMAQIHGAPTRQIADELAVSERMVQKYLARAMLHLALVDAGLQH
jgi:RNA polymerase sigma-70 factor (ECF subfamily)